MPLAEVKSAQRVLAIIDLLAQAPSGLTFAEIGQRLGYPRSSLHGLLTTLERARWVDREPSLRRYSLGVRAWETGQAYIRAISLADRSRPYMERVSKASGETVQLAILDGRDNVYIAKVEGVERLVLVSEVGDRLPAHATGLGKALLADLRPGEVRRLYRGTTLGAFTDKTIVSIEALVSQLTKVRMQGYATDAGEYTPGVRCIAVPIRDYSGRAVAAMSVSVPTVRFASQKQAKLLALLTEEALALSSALGHTRAGSSSAQ